MSDRNLILVVDDEPQIRKLLTITLQSNEFKVVEASTGLEALDYVAHHKPDLILLDLGLPDQKGKEVLRHLREWYSNPVIIISVQNTEEEIVGALDGGANDYIVKPFRTGELLARIRSAMRKPASESNESMVEFSGLSLDFANRVVRKKGVPIKLTNIEYLLLSLFARNEGKVLTHHFLLSQVWGPTYREESQYLRVFVAQLRKKLENDPNRPEYIITESGVGYRFMGTSAHIDGKKGYDA